MRPPKSMCAIVACAPFRRRRRNAGKLRLNDAREHLSRDDLIDPRRAGNTPHRRAPLRRARARRRRPRPTIRGILTRQSARPARHVVRCAKTYLSCDMISVSSREGRTARIWRYVINYHRIHQRRPSSLILPGTSHFWRHCAAVP